MLCIVNEIPEFYMGLRKRYAKQKSTKRNQH
jgi:hypothetical protein